MATPTGKRVGSSAFSHREMWLTFGILALLLAASAVPSSAYRYRPREDTTVKKVLRTVQKRGLNREALARQTAGYYEGLLDEAANVTRAGGRGLLDWRFWLIERAERGNREALHLQNRSDFLRFELRPMVDVPDIDERRRIVTNSVGMMDKEYLQTPTPGTWRIALVGDSVSQGIGAEFGKSYEARLEEYLNRQFAGRGYDKYEVLNFSVRGYQLTQLVDVALQRAPSYAPNVYLVALTERSVFASWADHLAGLVRNRIDLKYDFLRQLARDAQLTPNMSSELINARLAPRRDDVMRWALTELNTRARRDGAALVVALVPTADDPEVQIEQFDSTRRLLVELSIETVDLLETFAYLDDLAPARVSAADKHPNNEGHRMLFEEFSTQLETTASLRSIFVGPRAGTAPTSAATSAVRPDSQDEPMRREPLAR